MQSQQTASRTNPSCFRAPACCWEHITARRAHRRICTLEKPPLPTAMAAMQAEAKATVERAGTLTAGEMAKAKDAIVAEEIDINTDEGETIPTSYAQPKAVLLEEYEASVSAEARERDSTVQEI